MKGLYRRAAAAQERRVGSSLFLAQPATGELYRANSTVAAVWHALSEPSTDAELVSLFRQAFPRVGAQKLRTQVEVMLRDLVAAGLIERVTAGSKVPGVAGDTRSPRSKRKARRRTTPPTG